MVAPGNVNPSGAQAPPPPGQGRPPMKSAAKAAPQGGIASQPEGGYQGTPRTSSATLHNTEVLHQRRKLPVCPAKLAIGGFAVAAVLGYLTLYSNKKPEASALDVAKVTTNTASPQNTHPARKN